MQKCDQCTQYFRRIDHLETYKQSYLLNSDEKSTPSFLSSAIAVENVASDNESWSNEVDEQAFFLKKCISTLVTTINLIIREIVTGRITRRYHDQENVIKPLPLSSPIKRTAVYINGLPMNKTYEEHLFNSLISYLKHSWVQKKYHDSHIKLSELFSSDLQNSNIESFSNRFTKYAEKARATNEVDALFHMKLNK